MANTDLDAIEPSAGIPRMSAVPVHVALVDRLDVEGAPRIPRRETER